MARDCRSKERRACFKCNAKGHLARDCKSKKGQSSGTSRGSEKQGFFSFRSFKGASEEGGLELLVDLGRNGLMLKDRALFKELDEAFNTDVGNANRSRTRVEGRGTAPCGVLYSNGWMCELELKQAFWAYLHPQPDFSEEASRAGCNGQIREGSQHQDTRWDPLSFGLCQ